MWCDRHNVRLKTVVFNIKPKHTQFSTTLFVALACFSLFAVSLLLLLLLLVPFIVVSVVFLSIWFFFSCARLRFACTYEMHAEYLSWRGFFLLINFQVIAYNVVFLTFFLIKIQLLSFQRVSNEFLEKFHLKMW